MLKFEMRIEKQYCMKFDQDRKKNNRNWNKWYCIINESHHSPKIEVHSDKCHSFGALFKNVYLYSNVDAEKYLRNFHLLFCEFCPICYQVNGHRHRMHMKFSYCWGSHFQGGGTNDRQQILNPTASDFMFEKWYQSQFTWKIYEHFSLCLWVVLYVCTLCQSYIYKKYIYILLELLCEMNDGERWEKFGRMMRQWNKR